jgi:hypothetical protein
MAQMDSQPKHQEDGKFFQRKGTRPQKSMTELVVQDDACKMESRCNYSTQVWTTKQLYEV